MRRFAAGEGTILVAGTIERVGGKYRFVEKTKSSGSRADASRRTITLPDFLRSMLAAHLGEFTVDDPDAWVFSMAKGGLPPVRQLPHARLVSGCRRGRSRRTRVSRVRHTAAVFFIDEGADAFTLTQMLGHKDVRTTFAHYSHKLPNKQAEIAAGLDRRRREAAERSTVAQTRPKVIELPQ